MAPASLDVQSRAAAVQVRGLHRTFSTAAGEKHVLSNVSLDVPAGGIVALIGASGCGKSTLLREICGLNTPEAGAVLIGDSPVTGIDPRCAVAFQEPRLLPWRTIAENIALGLPSGVDKETGKARVAELISLVGLVEAANLRPRQISGGMAQRASLARALARNPAVLLLDEPFGALDALTRLRMQDLLLDIHAAEPTTIVMVTHDVEEALYLADDIALLAPAPNSHGAHVASLTTVPGSRPRSRTDAVLAHLRQEMLEGLGVSRHH
ncbi:ABC transporter ATP-binding protein [Ornithinimicrobium sp. Arc0846-15]|nr:ABC transporter ATP-binding protein [Ornithinimicrobium laminariae]